MSLVASAVEPSAVTERRAGVRTPGQWLVLGCYLAAAVVLTWRLWADPASRVQVGDPNDVDLYAWFLRYEATAVAHARLPALATAALNAPRGVSLMWNTSLLLPGVLLAPVTLLAGPQATLTVMLTLGFAGSAASLFLVLRRWGAGLAAAALGGAVYGFSPALLNSGIGHYGLQFAVLPPLIIDALARILTGRGHPVRTGIWLGLLTAAQLFTGEELLTDTALAGLLLTLAIAAARPRAAARLHAAVRPRAAIRRRAVGRSRAAARTATAQGATARAATDQAATARAADAAVGLATGAVVMLLISGRALWAQFHGPLREHYVPRYTHYTSYFGAHPAVFVTPPGSLLFHTRASAAAAASYPTHLSEYLAYLGWPLLAVLAAAAVCYWHDPRVRVTAITFAALELLSLGGRYRVAGPFLPWHWLQGLPVLSELLPDRLAVLADGAAAALLAFALDRARSPSQILSPSPARSPGPAHSPRLARSATRVPGRRRRLATAGAVLAVLPLTPLPFQAVPATPVPAGWQAAFARLRLADGARVLVVPIPDNHFTQAMRWQADTGAPASLIGGFFLGPGPAGITRVDPGPAAAAAQYLDPLWAGHRPPQSRPLAQSRSLTQSLAQLRADLRYWHPAAVVEIIRRGSQVGPVLTGLLGRPAFRIGQSLVWRL